MTFGVCASAWLSVALRFSGLRGKSARLHGHDYKVTVCVEGELSPDTNMVIDYCTLDEMLRSCVEPYDYKDLCSILGVKNPSAELLARKIHDCLAEKLKPEGGKLKVSRVEICSPIGFCVYYEP